MGAVGPSAEPGYTTTEFWVALVTSVIGLLVLFNIIKISNGQTQAIVGLVALVAPQVIYILSRGIRKIGTSA
jgi:ABC-type spermidine/putrescine transport system permease subunit II